MPTNMNLVFMPKKIAIYVLVVPKRHEHHTSYYSITIIIKKWCIQSQGRANWGVPV